MTKNNNEQIFRLTECEINVLKRAIDKYGKEAQFDMAVEEMSELTKGICKLKRARRDADGQPSQFQEFCESHVLEELADVLIMAVQADLIIGRPGEIQRIIDSKIYRLKNRMDSNTEALL